MAIVRDGESLSLIDPIRLNDDGERQLAALGIIENLVRLGAHHGVDDRYYVDKFDARLWSQPGGTVYPQPSIDVELSAQTSLPFPNATLIEFVNTQKPECALHIDDGSGILFTCDAIQNYGDYSYCNLIARMMLPFLGFSKTTLVGPIWLKLMTPEGGSLESDLRRLISPKYDRLLSAHGTFLSSGARRAVEDAIDKAFPGK